MNRIILFFLLVFSFSACKTQQSITPLDYALLSAHVYQDGTRELPSKFESFVIYEEEEASFGRMLTGMVRGLDVGKVIELSQEEEKGELIQYLAIKAVASGGYYGQAYLEKKTNTLIIAHRGTDNLIDAFVGAKRADKKTARRLWAMVRDLDDDYEIYAGKIPRDQYLEAQAFTRKVRKAYRQQFNVEPKIIHTGHSLGAVLAELCAVADHSKAVTFESPGTAPLIAELEQVAHQFNPKLFDAASVDITSYNAEPNRINTLHQHLGKVVPLYNDRKALTTYSEDDLFENVQRHSIDTLLIRFNPRTGNPKK